MTDAPPCPHCGQPVKPGDVYCPRCGGALPGAPPRDGTIVARDEAEGASPWRAVLARLEVVTQGRFAIERELGEGGMAAVYLARDLSLQRKVAIKVLSPAMLMERGMVGRFKQEAVTIAALRHPNIVTVHGVEHHEQLQFFVLDFVEGGSLEQVLARYGPLPIPAAVAWLAQVAAALEYAHRRNVIHRDIKPGNVLLDRDGNAIVTDFGIAKVAEKSGFTQTGTTMGTPAYMSPEQCLARPVGPASDQYSLGIMAYQMLTGRAPFQGAALEVMRAHTDDVPPPVTDVRPDCPPAVARVVARMLEKDPDARWPNLAEAMVACGASPPGLGDPVWEHLAGLVRGDAQIQTLGSSATPTTPLPGRPAAPARPRRRHAGLVGLGMVAVVVVIGTVLATLGRDDGGPPAPAATTTIAAALDVGPVPDALVVGDEVLLTATLRDSAGAALATPSATWTSSDAAVASVADGRVRAHQAGRATITARSGGLATIVVLEVAAGGEPTTAGPRPVVAAVRLTPDALTLAVGDTRRLDAVAVDAGGRPVAGSAVAWTVRDPGVATVSRDGLVTGRGVGVTGIAATVGDRRATVTVTVAATVEAVASVVVAPDRLDLETGQSAQLGATVTGTRGSRLGGRPVTWQSTNAAVASVNGDGRVTAMAAGVAVVSATVDGRTAQAAVTVRAPAPAVTDEEAGRLIRRWIEGFATGLDAAIRARDLAAVRRAYGAPMPAADVAEWQQRLGLDARWQARFARTYPPRRVGTTWVSDFEVTITVESAGRRQQSDQRFFAVFEPAPGAGLAVTSLEMRLADER